MEQVTRTKTVAGNDCRYEKLMRERSREEILSELRSRGARRLRVVSLRANRSTMWSLTQNATALNLHLGYAGAPEAVLDAFAIIVVERGRNTEAGRQARAVVSDWPGLAVFLEREQAKHLRRQRIQARCGDSADVTHCCGTPEQRAYLRAIYRYFNDTRCGGILPADMPLRLSNRMRSSLGHMLPGHRDDEGRYVAEIALNVDLMLAGNGPERVDTLLHEMAHAADYLHSGSRGHGASWRAWAHRLGCRADREYDRPVVRRRRWKDDVTRVPPLPAALRRRAVGDDSASLPPSPRALGGGSLANGVDNGVDVTVSAYPPGPSEGRAGFDGDSVRHLGQ